MQNTEWVEYIHDVRVNSMCGTTTRLRCDITGILSCLQHDNTFIHLDLMIISFYLAHSMLLPIHYQCCLLLRSSFFFLACKKKIARASTSFALWTKMSCAAKNLEDAIKRLSEEKRKKREMSKMRNTNVRVSSRLEISFALLTFIRLLKSHEIREFCSQKLSLRNPSRSASSRSKRG